MTTEIAFRGDNSGLLVGQNNGSITNAQFCEIHETLPTAEEIDRLCIRALRCADSLVVKNRLKENKDKLLPRSIGWIQQDPQYKSWQDGDEVCLLWIKGGAGKGKTMISIGLIEELSRPQHESTIVTYFFCQNADYELNTLEAIIKGLILQLVNQQPALSKALRRRWDATKGCFQVDEDMTSWRTLWNVLLEMLESCECQRVYIIVDALDECRGDSMACFLRAIVRNGLHRPSKIKWMLTSRPLDSAQRELLTSHDQLQVSLELNSTHVSQAVSDYIASKVKELSRRHKYPPALTQELRSELTEKAEGTFLWVSLACKRLESVCQEEALVTIQTLPPGLHSFYDRIFSQLIDGERDEVGRSMFLLKVMMLTYRPLNIEEFKSVTGLISEENAIRELVDRCASFIKIQGSTVHFIHQSARDYLAEGNGQHVLDTHQHFGHDEIALNCLVHLSELLKPDLLGLQQPDSTRESLKIPKHGGSSTFKLLATVDYAATFWVQHLQHTVRIAEKLEDMILNFLRTNVLEWFECLSLLDKLPRAIDALKVLENLVTVKDNHWHFESALAQTQAIVQDARRILLRQFHIITNWPLQIYISAIIFSPETSVVKAAYLEKIPEWLKSTTPMEDTWTSLVQTLVGHSQQVATVAFAPNGKHIASCSSERTSIKIWDATTGQCQKTLADHPSKGVGDIAFSPDGRQIASGSYDDGTIRLWDATTGQCQKTWTGHLSRITAIAFTPDGKQTWIASAGSDDTTIKIWDIVTGSCQKTLTGHLGRINTIAFSPDGKQISSGSNDKTIKIWDVMTGSCQKTLTDHLGGINAIAFSPDGKQISSGSDDKTIKIWDIVTGSCQKTLSGHSGWVNSIAFSPDGKQIASGSYDLTIKLWDATGIKEENLQKRPFSISDHITAVVFSPDGKQIASGSEDGTIELLDATTGHLQKTFVAHNLEGTSYGVFSQDGKYIASTSTLYNTINIWDTTTGDYKKLTTSIPSYPTRNRGFYLHITFSPNGRQIAARLFGIIDIWDVITGKHQKTLLTHNSRTDVRATAIVFSPDSEHIITGLSDGTIKLWDTTTGDCQRTLVGHSDQVTAIAFSSDGKQIFSASDDHTIKHWDIYKALKASKLFGRAFGSRSKFRSYQEVKIPERIHIIKFSEENRSLTTNIGTIKLGNPADANGQSFTFVNDSSSEHFHVRDQWIYYGNMAIIRIPSEFVIECHAVQADRLAIGLSNGRVLSFRFDRNILWSMTRDSSGVC